MTAALISSPSLLYLCRPRRASNLSAPEGKRLVPAPGLVVAPSAVECAKLEPTALSHKTRIFRLIRYLPVYRISDSGIHYSHPPHNTELFCFSLYF